MIYTQEITQDCDYCGAVKGEVCSPKCTTKVEEQLTWSELAELTHETQVDKFGWCMCEDTEPHEHPYEDCPKTGE